MLKYSIAFLFFTMSTFAAVTIEKIGYRGWPNSYRISNGTVELVVTTDVGPRIIRYGFIGGQNLMKEFDAQMGHSGEPTWQARGGHRVWIGPEDRVTTYAPDNGPVDVKVSSGVLVVTAPAEKETGVVKSISIKLAPEGAAVELIHRLTNKAAKARRLAPWSLTMMAQGGMGIIPFPERRSHEEYLLPTNPLTMWGFTDFSDPRWKFTTKYLLLRQDRDAKAAQKTGIFREQTYGAYLLGSDLFVKHSTADASKTYPDYGCSFEMYTDSDILEVETLGPLVTLRPGANVEHTEHWNLYKDVHIPAWTDEEIDRAMLPAMK